MLIELGVSGGRCGVVDSKELALLVAEIANYQSLALAGIEVYEGVLSQTEAVSQFMNMQSQRVSN